YADIAGGVTIRLKFGICRIDDKAIPVEILCDRVAQVAKSLDSDIFKSVAWYSQEIKSNMLLEQRLAGDMKEGLENEQFAVFLQPIVNCEDGVISGSEALVRWFHPTLGMIVPNSFIPLFERNGLIIQLDKYMVEQICRLLALRIESGGPRTYISVNLSMRTIFGCDIVRFLSETVDRHGLDRSLLRLEITESVVARNQAQFNSITGSLHKAGFCVMMDDFGSEYSSLNALMSLEFDVIKLDMKFIKDYAVSNKSRSILEAILMMARWIGVDTVVEGVETADQLEFLYSLGCDQVQGFYYSKPLPAKEFFEFQDMFTPVKPSRS
ncbi:MAG: EAL domain-containing protein, partial [Sphaerochaetaceae bacterium]